MAAVIALHPGTLYSVSNIVLNYYLNWFSTFRYWTFIFQHFGWKLPMRGQIFMFVGVNMDQI